MEAYYLACFLFSSEKETELVNSKYFARRKAGASNERIIHGQGQLFCFR